VHGRVTTQRPGEPVTPAQMEIVRAVAEALTIPVFANGGSLDMHNYEDVIAFRDAAGCSSVMVARAAQHNLSVFRKEGASCGTSACDLACVLRTRILRLIAHCNPCVVQACGPKRSSQRSTSSLRSSTTTPWATRNTTWPSSCTTG
jgi:tRNA-dihydrouridine synthase